jgi:hypothetical protein
MRRICLFLAAGAVLGGALASSGTAPAVAASGAHPAARTTTCGQVDKQFRPRKLSIPHVIGRTRILPLGRDRRGVPRPPPLTDKGKWELAWDKDSRIRPGSPHGVVRLTAHTYPRFAGVALGNRLLARLHTGARLSVSGPHGEQLCYRVVKRVRVRATQSVPAYYTSTGPPRLAILVCSGKRRGPGDWSHRTIWFAAPTLKAADR